MIKNNLLSHFEDRVDGMVTVKPVPELPERYALINEVCEDFYKTIGQTLPAFMLSRLCDWVLIEILNDRDVDKVSNAEFAILSPRQLRRRDKRENSVEGGVMDYLNLKYTKHKDSLSKKTKKESE